MGDRGSRGDGGSRWGWSLSAFCFGSGGLCTGGRRAGRLMDPEEEEEDGPEEDGGGLGRAADSGDRAGDGGGDGASIAGDGAPAGGDLGGLGGAGRAGGFVGCATTAAVVGNTIRGADAAGPSPKSTSPTVSPSMSPSIISGRDADAWFARGDPAGVCIELDSDAESGTSVPSLWTPEPSLWTPMPSLWTPVPSLWTSVPWSSAPPPNSSERRAFPFAGLDAALSPPRPGSEL